LACLPGTTEPVSPFGLCEVDARNLSSAVDRGGPFHANANRTESSLARKTSLKSKGRWGAELVREQGVGSSNLPPPTIVIKALGRALITRRAGALAVEEASEDVAAHGANQHKSRSSGRACELSALCWHSWNWNRGSGARRVNQAEEMFADPGPGLSGFSH
jgi:hypothetical protein